MTLHIGRVVFTVACPVHVSNEWQEVHSVLARHPTCVAFCPRAVTPSGWAAGLLTASLVSGRCIDWKL